MCYIILPDETSLHRKHVHTGSAHGFQFEVEYLVREVEVRAKPNASLAMLGFA